MLAVILFVDLVSVLYLLLLVIRVEVDRLWVILDVFLRFSLLLLWGHLFDPFLNKLRLVLLLLYVLLGLGIYRILLTLALESREKIV